MEQILEEINTNVEVFTDGKDTYIYDITLIKAWQSECAKETLLFRNDYMQNQRAKDVRSMIKSGATSWLLQTGAFLLRRRNADGTIDKFDPDKAMGEILDFTKEMNREDKERLGACVENFFSGSLEDSNLLNQNLSTGSNNAGEISSREVLVAMMQTLFSNNTSNKST